MTQTQTSPFMSDSCRMAGFAGAGANGILGSTFARNSVVSRLGNFLVSRRSLTPQQILLKFGRKMRLKKALIFPFM